MTTKRNPAKDGPAPVEQLPHEIDAEDDPAPVEPRPEELDAEPDDPAPVEQ